MKALVNSLLLGKILKKISPAIKKNTVLPVLSAVKLQFDKKVLTVTGTDLETIVQVKMSCESNDSFILLIDFVDISDVCTKLRDEPLLIDASGEQILITSDKSKFKFSKFGKEDHFPVLPEEEFLFSTDVDADFFGSLFCANICKSDQDINPRMHGVSINFRKGKVSITATDAFVAYRNTINTKNDHEAHVLVPGSFVQMAKGFDTAKISVGEKFIKAETESETIITRLFDVKFVDFDMIVPKEINYNFKINRPDFVESLGVTGIAASLSTKSISIKFNGGDVKLSAQNIDFGKESETTIKAQHEVEIPEIGINGSQMLKVLNLFDSEEVEMAFRGHQQTIFLRPFGEPNILCMIQPIMINA